MRRLAYCRYCHRKDVPVRKTGKLRQHHYYDRGVKVICIGTDMPVHSTDLLGPKPSPSPSSMPAERADLPEEEK